MLRWLCMRRRLPISRQAIGLVMMAGTFTSPAAAQTPAERPDPLRAPAPAEAVAKWTFELRAGVGAATTPSGGTGQLPLPGQNIAGTHNVPVPRSASSFFFGDGAAQWNSVFPDAAMQPIDAILQSPIARRTRGSVVGLTVGRQVSTRWRAEVNLDLAFQQLAVTPAAQTAMQNSIVAFAQAFPPLGGSASATVGGTTRAGREFSVTGGATYWLDTRGRVRKFVSVGGGALVDAEGPVATLAGFSQLVVPLSNGQAVFSNSDHLTVHSRDGHVRATAYVGGGFERALTARTGLRVLLRAGFAPARQTTTLDAAPSVSRTGPSDALIFSGPSQTIVFSTASAPLATLSAPPIKGFQTFSGTGLRVQAILSAGYFFRF